jgi:hypothetical protein
MRITHYWKHGQYITVYYKGGREETIERKDFEAYANDKRENEEGNPLSWDEYYSDPILSLADVQTYLDIIKRKAIIAHTQEMIKSFAV